MLFITHKLQAYLLKITSGRWPPFTSMHCCKHIWKLPYKHLRRSSSIAATLSTMACLSSWIVMEHTVFQEPPQEKIWHSMVGWPSRPSDVSETRDKSSEHFANFAPLWLTIWNGVLSSTNPLPANHYKLPRQRNIQIWNASVGSAPPCIYTHLRTYTYVK